MDINAIMKKLREHPESSKMGMIASHLGVVRDNSRDGRAVTQVEVNYDHDVVEKILKEAKVLPGIVDVVIETREGLLEIGDEIMFVAVGGDIRENVFPALVEIVDRIKKEASKKQESFV